MSEEHLKWLPENYFPIVMQVNRYPRYTNNRTVDSFVKLYLDENDIAEETEWGLPVPNQEAAYKSMAKYAKDLPLMSNAQVNDMNEAWRWTERHFFPYMGGARIKTVSEVIDNLDKTTSSGYPFNVWYSKKGELLEKFPDFEEWVAHDWDVNMLQDNWTFCFTNSLKEEIRPAAKIEANKIRTFTAGAVDGTVQGNRLFSDMNEKMNEGYLKTASGVGMSPLNGNWDLLYRKLNVFKKGYALDESEYDSSLRAYLMWGCAKCRWAMYRDGDRTPENLHRLRVYYRNLVNSLIITPEGVLVMKLGGNPSGSCNTINDNTLILYCLMAYAWIRVCPNLTESSYLEFELNTAKILVGDDNTWTVSDWAHEFYNAKSVIMEWALIGITTTTDSLEPRSAEELDFLSAKTIFYQGKAIPVYDRAKLMASLLYSETAQQKPSFTLLRAAALMQVGWSDTQFRHFCREFIQWLLDHFDEVCCEDADWLSAKCSILSDGRLAQLFLGEEVLFPQSLSGDERKIKTPDKVRNYKMQANSNGGRRARRGRGNKATRTIVVDQRDVRFKGPGTKIQVSKKSNRSKKRKVNGRGRASGPRGVLPPRRGQGMLNTGNRVGEREEILDITGNGSNFGVVNTININPGNAVAFPTLSIQAKVWQRYRFRSLRYEYQPTVSEFSTAGTTGKVIFTVNPDAADGAPTTKVAAYATDRDLVKSDLPCRGFSLSVPARKLMPVGKDWRFVRPGNLPGAADIREYDVGNLFVSTTGTTDNTTKLGELHVFYTIEFETMINNALEAAPQNNSVSLFQTTGTQALATGVTSTMLVATATTNGLAIVNTAGSMVLPAGNYLVDVSLSVHDSVSEFFDVVLDLTKNGTSLTLGTYSPQIGIAAAGAADVLSLANSYYVSSSGTDALLVRATATGAAGTLVGNASIRIVAI